MGHRKKNLGSRRSDNDHSLESRILNISMKETRGEYIPLNLNIGKFEADFEAIRSMLFKWSLETYIKVYTSTYSSYIDKQHL